MASKRHTESLTFQSTFYWIIKNGNCKNILKKGEEYCTMSRCHMWTDREHIKKNVNGYHHCATLLLTCKNTCHVQWVIAFIKANILRVVIPFVTRLTSFCSGRWQLSNNRNQMNGLLKSELEQNTSIWEWINKQKIDYTHYSNMKTFWLMC